MGFVALDLLFVVYRGVEKWLVETVNGKIQTPILREAINANY